MVTVLHNTDLARPLFEGWEDTMIYSCPEGVMGSIPVTDEKVPLSAFAVNADFGFLAGRPSEELLLAKPRDVHILTATTAQASCDSRLCGLDLVMPRRGTVSEPGCAESGIGPSR